MNLLEMKHNQLRRKGRWLDMMKDSDLALALAEQHVDASIYRDRLVILGLDAVVKAIEDQLPINDTNLAGEEPVS
jgi:hypothetical protein